MEGQKGLKYKYVDIKTKQEMKLWPPFQKIDIICICFFVIKYEIVN